eukprot:gb/GFBE01051923.1/.p1 GENE.gb/GFBE01051923.1/~~gb/GFBE01051923.1/.p1  ORF type:complete len:214 (+),score=36.64 gb/GFBE01051923.1/:1-642(+)
MLDLLADAKERLAKPDARVIPAQGTQYAMLVSSPELAMLSTQRPNEVHGLQLSAANCLLDTGSIMTTKGRGIRLGAMSDLVEMSERVELFSVAFGSTTSEDLPSSKSFRLHAKCDGVVHAVVTSWEAWDADDSDLRMTTHFEDTAAAPWGLARDLHWGQGIQFVEDCPTAGEADRYRAPAPFVVRAGEPLELTVTLSTPEKRSLQCSLARCSQ